MGVGLEIKRYSHHLSSGDILLLLKSFCEINSTVATGLFQGLVATHFHIPDLILIKFTTTCRLMIHTQVILIPLQQLFTDVVVMLLFSH